MLMDFRSDNLTQLVLADVDTMSYALLASR